MKGLRKCHIVGLTVVAGLVALTACAGMPAGTQNLMCGNAVPPPGSKPFGLLSNNHGTVPCWLVPSDKKSLPLPGEPVSKRDH